jgi:two-component system, OmpR family, sensor histidine kinase ChvG
VRLPRPRLAIPLKLVLVSSLLLLIPWVGLLYVRELERLLLRVQEQGLVSTARAVATALNDRPSLLLSGEVYSVPASLESDLRVPSLDRPIVADGRASDWDQAGVEPRVQRAPDIAGEPPFWFRYRIGRHGTGVYALFEVEDDRVVLRDPDRPDLAASDHLQIAVVTADDEFLRFAVDARGDGPVSAWLVLEDGSRVPDSRISGRWASSATGFLVELRLPRTLIGPRLSFAVVDVDDPETRTLVGQLGTAGTATREQLGSVLVPSPEISDLIRGLGRAWSRIWVLDVNRRVLAHAGTLRRPAPAPPAGPDAPSFWDRLTDAWVRPLARHLLDEPREDFQDVAPGTYKLEGREVASALAGREATRWRLTPDSRAVVLSAAHPVWVESQVRGVVLVEETTNDVLAVRNREFGKLFAAILAVSLLGAVALLVFASRLSWRIRRLRDGVEHAIDRQGRVSGTVKGTSAGDEIGDLARSFADILDRQRHYTAYLEQVGNRLSHEIRTPVGVVRSSLDNLRLQPLPAEARVYIDRADEGLRRLATILSRMSEAARLEPALAATEREPFDLAAVVRGCVEGYRLANRGREILLQEPGEPLPVLGAPDLVAQMLDKLVDNALSFARPGTPVRVQLSREGRAASLSVENQGPPLPAQMKGRLFESMVSIRPAGGEGEPHLGLGLYIVRLIAAFHGGEAKARDRDGGDGVVVEVSMPLPTGGPGAEALSAPGRAGSPD